MFEIIEGINIGQGPGNAFGGGIYAASCDIGFSNGPTKITLNVVSEGGIYQSVYPNVTSSPYNINLNGKIFSGMYLYSYEKTKSAGSSLLSLNFVDSSIILDKIYIGLLNRHGNLYTSSSIITGTFTVRCPSCTEGIITGLSGQARRYVDSIPNGHYFKKSEDGGGYIILGKEYFPESNCEIPRVDYSFSELCEALTDFGISHELSIFDINPYYRQEYAGTLREVLNNWGSDFSFEFYYDGKTLKAIDLRQPINIDAIEDFASINQYVVSSSYGETLENTYTQSVVARYLKPSTAIEYNNTFHFKQPAVQVSLADILKNGSCAGRNGNSLLVSIGLARLDRSLREAYLGNLAATYNDTTYLQALGFRNNTAESLPYKLEGKIKATIVYNSTFCQKESNTSNNPCNPDNYAVYIGVFREDIKQAVEDWDSEAADFLGKYYYFLSPLPVNTFDCPFSSDWFIYYTYNSQWTTVPYSNIYGGDALPFSNLLRDPISQTTYTNYRNLNLISCDDNSWGIEVETYNAAKGSDADYDTFKPQIMLFVDQPVAANIQLYTIQNQAIESLPSAVLTSLQQTAFEKGAEVAFCIIPLLNKIPNAPQISKIIGRTVNPLVYNRMSSRVDSDETASRCNTFCDENIVSEICNCGAQYTPVPYFQYLYGYYFQVRHSNRALSTVIFPVDSTYYGYFTHTRYYKTTSPPVKKIYGTPPSAPNNTLSTRVIDYDITPDIDAVMDINDAINLYIYSPTNNTIMTAQDYYDELANLNDLSIPAQKKVNMTISKADLSDLGIPITPENGLIGMSISLFDGGMQTQLSYASRPPVVPKPEAVFSKIKFRLKGKG